MMGVFVKALYGFRADGMVRLGPAARGVFAACCLMGLGTGLPRAAAADSAEKDAGQPPARDPLDRVVLCDGKIYTGTLLEILEDKVILRYVGRNFYIPRKDVRRIHRELPQIYDEFFKKKAKETSTVDAWWSLAKFFESKRAFPEQRACLRAMLKLDPDNEKARRALGHARLDGRWLTEEEVDEKRDEGYVVVDGNLVKPTAEAETAKPSVAEPASAKVAPDPQRPPAQDAEDALRRSERLLSKDIDGALYYAREAVLLAPEHPQAAVQWQKVAAKAAKAKFEAAKKALKSGEKEKAVELLLESFALFELPEVASELRRLKYVQHLGSWYPKEAIPGLERAENENEQQIRARLEIASREFRKLRTSHFRVFTNMPEGGEWDAWLGPVLIVLESHYQKFSWIFVGETDRAAAEKGFTVVFFRDHAAYNDYLARKRIGFSFPTAGFYSHELESAFFFRDPNYGTLWPVLLHEVTHQLCREYLHAATRVTWVSEGVAQYFQAARVEKDYTITVGCPLGKALLDLRGGYCLDEARYVPAEAIFRATAVDDPRLRCSVRQAYAQMWAWVYFFLHQSTAHRQTFLACLREERDAIARSDWTDPHILYIETLAKHGFRLGPELDEAYKAFVRRIW